MTSFLDRYPTLPPFGPEIPKLDLPQGEKRPVISVMVPVYRVSETVRETLQCLMAADLGADLMDITVVDNSKQSDALIRLIAECETTRIGYYKQPKQLPCAENWNAAIRIAKGEWVHLLHEDDTVQPHFYKTFLPMLQGEDGRKAGAAFCRSVYISHHSQELGFYTPLEAKTPGLLTDYLPVLAMNNRLECPAIIVKRSVYEALGAFETSMTFAHDWYMWLRIAMRYPMLYHPEAMASYRLSDDSLTRELQTSGRNVDELFSIYATAAAQLPSDEHRAKLVKHVAVNQSKDQLKVAVRLWLEGNSSAGLTQMKRVYHNKVNASSFWQAVFKLLQEEGHKVNKLFQRKKRLIVHTAS